MTPFDKIILYDLTFSSNLGSILHRFWHLVSKKLRPWNPGRVSHGHRNW